MNSNSSRWVLYLLVGLSLFFFAHPFGNFVGSFFKLSVPPIAKPISAPSTKLLTLKLKRDVLKGPVGTEPDEPKLPASKVNKHVGTLSNEEVEETIKQRQPLFQRCWTQRLKENPSLKGNILLQFEINQRGKVQDVQVAQAAITDELMTRCLISVLERIPFREFEGGNVTLTFPLSFE
jgi:hypothetical protein